MASRTAWELTVYMMNAFTFLLRCHHGGQLVVAGRTSDDVLHLLYIYFVNPAVRGFTVLFIIWWDAWAFRKRCGDVPRLCRSELDVHPARRPRHH